MTQSQPSSSATATPYFPSDLQDGKVCEDKLIQKLRSYGLTAVVNVRRNTLAAPQI